MCFSIDAGVWVYDFQSTGYEMPHGSPGGAISQMVGVFGKLVNTRCRRIELGDRAGLADGVATILLSLLFVVFQERHTHSPCVRRRSSTAASSLPGTLVISRTV